MAVVPPDTFVVSRQPGLQLRPGCRQVQSVEEGIAAGVATGKPVFIIGGAPIYEAAWPYCERFYLTRIEGSFAGDTPLPASIPFARWRVVNETSKTYRERRTGVDVVCRFIEYAQDNPQALP
jgi:dihydrofolate reductase